jgi:hypothetical protein
MASNEHIVAVVEPTKDGEATLDIAHQVVDRGGKATVLILLTNATMNDVRAFAAAEDIGFGDALEIFRERLAETYAARVGVDPSSTIVANHLPMGRTVFDAATEASATIIALPQRLARARGWRGPLGRSRLPVVIAPPAAA